MATAINHKLANRLNDLLTYLHDSEKGLKECAKVIKKETLKPILMAESHERYAMIQSLESQLRSAGEKPTERGTVAGPMHRLYLDLKALITNGDEDVLLTEIKRGDNALINSYKEILREDLPLDLDRTLHAQLDHIQNVVKDLDRASI